MSHQTESTQWYAAGVVIDNGDVHSIIQRVDTCGKPFFLREVLNKQHRNCFCKFNGIACSCCKFSLATIHKGGLTQSSLPLPCHCRVGHRGDPPSGAAFDLP